MGKIIELPTLERPREKALHYGIETLSDYELIALLIGSGSKGSSAVDIAYQMLSVNHGLYYLVRKPFSDLLSFKGMGEKKAIKISAAFEIAKRFNNLKRYDKEKAEDSSHIYQIYKGKILDHNQSQEILYLIILDKEKHIIHEVNLYKGNENSINYSIKQIIHQVLLHNGFSFYVVHNHPSGKLDPSEGDVFFTLTLIQDCRKLNIIMEDHLIITEYGYYSFLTQDVYTDN